MKNFKSTNLLEKTNIVDVDVVGKPTATSPTRANCCSDNSRLINLHSSIIDKLSSPSRARKQLQ